MPSEYDALLTAAPPVSEYDALIQASPPPSAPASQLPAQDPATAPTNLRNFLGLGPAHPTPVAPGPAVPQPGEEAPSLPEFATTPLVSLPDIPHTQDESTREKFERSIGNIGRHLLSGASVPLFYAAPQASIAASVPGMVQEDISRVQDLKNEPPLSAKRLETGGDIFTQLLLAGKGAKEAVKPRATSAVSEPSAIQPSSDQLIPLSRQEIPPTPSQLVSPSTVPRDAELARGEVPARNQLVPQPETKPVSSLPQGPTEPGVSIPKPNEEIPPNGETVGPQVQIPEEIQATPNGEVTTGVANRVLANESERIGTVDPGEGMSWQEMVDLGRNELNKGADPQQIARRLQRTGRISPTDFAVLRAERERLAQQTVQAEQAVRANPNDVGAQQTYNDARAAETTWVKEVVQPAKTQTSDIFRGMQGEAPVDVSTFAGMRRAVVDLHGREPTLPEVRALDQASGRVRQATAESVRSLQDATSRIERRYGRRAPKRDIDTLRDDLHNRLKELTPC